MESEKTILFWKSVRSCFYGVDLDPPKSDGLDLEAIADCCVKACEPYLYNNLLDTLRIIKYKSKIKRPKILYNRSPMFSFYNKLWCDCSYSDSFQQAIKQELVQEFCNNIFNLYCNVENDAGCEKQVKCSESIGKVSFKQFLKDSLKNVPDENLSRTRYRTIARAYSENKTIIEKRYSNCLLENYPFYRSFTFNSKDPNNYYASYVLSDIVFSSFTHGIKRNPYHIVNYNEEKNLRFKKDNTSLTTILNYLGDLTLVGSHDENRHIELAETVPNDRNLLFRSICNNYAIELLFAPKFIGELVKCPLKSLRHNDGYKKRIETFSMFLELPYVHLRLYLLKRCLSRFAPNTPDKDKQNAEVISGNEIEKFCHYYALNVFPMLNLCFEEVVFDFIKPLKSTETYEKLLFSKKNDLLSAIDKYYQSNFDSYSYFKTMDGELRYIDGQVSELEDRWSFESHIISQAYNNLRVCSQNCFKPGEFDGISKNRIIADNIKRFMSSTC